MRDYRSTANPVIHLQLLDFSKEKINLIHIAAPGIPTRLLHKGARSAKRKRRRKIPNIKPHRLPVDYLITQLIRDVLRFLPLAKLQTSSPNYIYPKVIGMRLQVEEILKQIKVGAQSPGKLHTDGQKSRCAE